MKDVMENYTARTQAVRVSKTSASSWVLYGPIDQALKTSIQTEAVRVIPLRPSVHGVETECELWISATPITADCTLPPNLNAVMIMEIQKLRDSGHDLRSGAFMIPIHNVTPVVGPAILTGPGATDLSEEYDISCLINALLGCPE